VGRDGAVGIATPCGLNGPGFESRRGGGAKFSAPIQIGTGAHPATYTMGTESFLGVKRAERGVDHPYYIGKGKGKAVPLQAWTGPEGSRRLRLPDFKTIGT